MIGSGRPYRAGGEVHVLRFDLATTAAEALKQRSAAALRAPVLPCG